MLVARVSHQLSMLLGLIILARYGSTDSTGKYVLALAFCSPYVMFANMQLHVALSGDSAGRFKVYEYAIHRVVAQTLAMISICVVAGVFCNEWNKWQIIVAMGVAKFVESLSDFLCGIQQRDERMGIVARSIVFRSFAALLGLGAGFMVTKSVLFAVLCIAILWLFCLLFHDVPAALCLLQRKDDSLFPNSWSKVHWARIASLGKFVFPLGVASGIGSLELNVPRYIVGFWLGESALGLFGTLLALTMSGQLIMAAVAQSTIPRLARLKNNGQYGELASLTQKLYGVGIGAGVSMTLGLGLFGEWLLFQLFGVELAREMPLLMIVSLATTIQFGAAMLSTTLRSIQRYQQSMFAHIAGLVVSVVACAVFVDRYGVLGIGYGMALSATFSTGVLAFLLRDVLFASSQRDISGELEAKKISTGSKKQVA